jgi:hypothetical protein
MRARGISDRRQQRVDLFIAGARLDIGLVRRDLHYLYRRNAKRINRDYGTEFLTASDPMPRKVTDEAQMLLQPQTLKQC